jgi:uncharacterized membrane protein HdeD (DUF308 family)
VTTTDAVHKLQRLGGAPWWAFGLLGIVLIIASLFILTHVVAATIISAVLFGVILVVSGGFEIAHAFWAKGWGGFLSNLAVGVLYMLAGAVLLYNPVVSSLLLTLVFAASLIFSGAIRAWLSYRYWQQLGWVLLVSGLIGILAGIAILSGWPVAGLWVFGLCLGIDLLFFGVWWVGYALLVRRVL